MTERARCDGCGIGVGADRLSIVGDRALCPRCFALEGPSTIQSPVRSTGGSPPAGERRGDEGRRTHEPGGIPERPAGRLARVDTEVRAWAAGRSWWVRAPVLVWLVWILVRAWDDPTHTTLFHGIDLAFHEIGHILWSPLGEFMGFAGGTLTQVLIPVAAGAVLYRQRDWFGVAFAVAWMGINCFEVVPYAGDALARRLPLVSTGGGEPIHDWAYMLGELGLLRHTAAVAAGWQWAGRILMLAGIGFGARVLWLMATEPAPGEAGGSPGEAGGSADGVAPGSSRLGPGVGIEPRGRG